MLRHYKTKGGFTKDLSGKTIKPEDICFIDDSKEIYTHGVYYASSDENKIHVKEGTSDGEGHIVDEIQAPSGFEAEIMSMMFLHPSTNRWTPCVGYKAGDGNSYIVTGEYQVELSGGSTVGVYKTNKYKIYYKLKPIIQ